ncbi:MAG TPA: molecular chaperone [Deltaproteobacteria bacterium]|nr:molecular chaperone [Deltaproteobacteria bacterium]
MTTKNSITKHRGGLVRQAEESPFLSLRREMERVFDEFWKGLHSWDLSEQTIPDTFNLRVDVTDTEDAFRIAAEVPGMDEKDIEVTLTRDTVTIKGEKKEKKEETTNDYYWMERSFGSFVRNIPLPAEIDTAKVQASLKKGVLTITLPKTATAIKEAKKIPVKTE